ncbi:helix-turn-helix domain-containing protein [Rhizobium subbaraonis]|nr:helix-turn-helix domain-containing protein [Rhizobium subbaraonis]
MALTAQGRSYRWIARDLGISKNTVADIVKRESRDDAAAPPAGVGVVLFILPNYRKSTDEKSM